MSQIPRIQKIQIVSSVDTLGAAPNLGPQTGIASPADISEYSLITGSFPLYSKGTKIGTAYELVEVNKRNMLKEVAVYAVAMIEAAEQDDIKLKVVSGFRTMEEQHALYNQSKSSNSMIVAKPGYCNHQTGIALDFNINDKQGRVYEWLVKNAYRFGFIRTVPAERWHWEYWGSWPEQTTPPWAGGEHGGSNKLEHRRLSMFSKVPRIHSCGDKKLGGNFLMLNSNWWTAYGASEGHIDSDTAGATNSWVGFSNEFLPDKFDIEDPEWDKQKF